MKKSWWARVAAVLAGAGFCLLAHAQQEIKIGVLLSADRPGRLGGRRAAHALELAADIINNGAPGVSELPLSAGKGLPNLKGAKIKLVFADHQANPQTGATEAERLITQEKVVALVVPTTAP